MASGSMMKDIMDGQIVTQTLDSMHSMQGGSSSCNKFGSTGNAGNKSSQLSAGTSKAAMDSDIVNQTLNDVNSMNSSSSSKGPSFYQAAGNLVSRKG